jgi:4-diphosphocytidyl-2-C-methyl-D-erythritol kinase
MVQREVGERLAAAPGTKAYGAVSVRVAYYANARVVGTVPPDVFVPRPNVDSALVRLDRHAEPPVAVGDPNRLFELVNAGFSTRRKTLRRAIGPLVDEDAYRAAGVDPGARAETLDLAHWAALTRASGRDTPTVRVDAFAKLTLSLRVVGVRADGMHELDMLVVPVSEPHDEVTIRRAAETTIRISGRGAEGVPDDKTNLAVRAARALGAELRIELRKGIAPGAGLGGGSADAAAVLAAVGGDDLDRVASTLGADVPFCLRATGPMRVQGVGERVEPVSLPELSIVIATPPFGCPTADVYRIWDELGGPEGRTVEIDGLPPLRNDLEPAAQHLAPRLVAFRDAVESAAEAPAVLAGSGSSYAVVFRDQAEAEAARARVADAVDGQVVVGRTVDVGVRVR